MTIVLAFVIFIGFHMFKWQTHLLNCERKMVQVPPGTLFAWELYSPSRVVSGSLTTERASLQEWSRYSGLLIIFICLFKSFFSG